MSDEDSRVHIDGLTHAEIALLKQVASEAAEQAVNKTFIRMGIDPDKPFESQADFAFLRGLRVTYRGLWFKVVLICVAAGTTLGLGWLWTGFKASLRAALPFALPLIMALALAAAALAHDNWISQQHIRDPASGEWCCNKNDCQAEKVREVRGGYSTDGGDVVPYSRVIPKSPDGQWWRCRYLGGEKAGKTRCLIGPLPNS